MAVNICTYNKTAIILIQSNKSPPDGDAVVARVAGAAEDARL
jgi:hypothetical protein